MILYHVTTVKALRSIRRDDCLDPRYSLGRREWTWFVPAFKVDWAVLRVQMRHAAKLKDVVIMEFDLAKGTFSEHAASCKYFRAVPTMLSECKSIRGALEWVDREHDIHEYQDWGPEAG